MRELSVAEQRYRAVMAVIGDGLTVSQAAEKTGVARQTLHTWLASYEAEGLEGLVDRSHRPVFELGKRGVGPLPSTSGVYRVLLRAGMIDPAARDRRSRKWKRWECGARRWNCGRWTAWADSRSPVAAAPRR
jgi:hypothetical protein